MQTNNLEASKRRNEILNQIVLQESHTQPEVSSIEGCLQAEVLFDEECTSGSEVDCLDESFQETTSRINDNLDNDQKFVVSWQQLKDLFIFCLDCGGKAEIMQAFTKGMIVYVKLECTVGHQTSWSSSPDKTVEDMHTTTAAAVLLSGLNISRFVEVMSIAKIACFTDRTYNRLQKKILFPSINFVIQKHRREWLTSAKEELHLELVGDGKCDFPGFNATYCTYTLMNEKSDQIIDFFVTHVTDAKNSQNMELYGLKNLLEEMTKLGINIDTLTTDQHKQVRCFLQKSYPIICHQFDIWHKAKGIKKKLLKAGKKKLNSALTPWIRSIINHFWWCCATSKENIVLLKEKWVSILFHICNFHKWNNAQVYHKCIHADLSITDVLSKNWLQINSPPYLALKQIVCDKKLLNVLGYFTKFKHSGNLESYHSLNNKYCPKRIFFTYDAMVARNQIAVLDHNSGLDRDQAKTKDGKLRHKSQWSKVTDRHVPKKIMDKKERKYVEEIINEIRLGNREQWS